MRVGDYVKIRLGPKGVADYGERIWVELTAFDPRPHGPCEGAVRGRYEGALRNDPITPGFEYGQKVTFSDRDILEVY